MKRPVQKNKSAQEKIYVTRKQVPELLFQRRLLKTADEAVAAHTRKKINKTAIDAVHEENTPELIRLLKAGAGKGALDDTGNSLIAIACWNGDIELVRILLEHDSKEEIFEKRELLIGYHYATEAGCTKVAELIKLYADEKD